MGLNALKRLLDFKTGSDEELFATLASLPAQRAEALHSCIRILNHISVVDRIFRAHLSAAPQLLAATNTEATPTLEELRRTVADTDAWLQAYVQDMGADALAETVDFRFTDGDSGRMTREEILLHLVTHGGYHRGNVGQILKSIGVAPPRDLYTRFLHDSEPARRG